MSNQKRMIIQLLIQISSRMMIISFQQHLKKPIAEIPKTVIAHQSKYVKMSSFPKSNLRGSIQFGRDLFKSAV